MSCSIKFIMLADSFNLATTFCNATTDSLAKQQANRRMSISKIKGPKFESGGSKTRAEGPGDTNPQTNGRGLGNWVEAKSDGEFFIWIGFRSLPIKKEY
jgi:hypothetical protein